MTHTYRAWQQQASKRLSPHSDSARLDAELLLCHVLDKPRSHLFAWPEKTVSPEQATQLEAVLARRLSGEPLAYITGEKEFWSLPLRVSAAVLQPRPDTELLVDTVLLQLPVIDQPARVLDLGTGSGAIACALAFERPAWQLIATDQSREALEIAKDNIQRLGLAQRIQCRHGNWFEALKADDGPFDCIVSNPPYIADNDPHLQGDGTRYEPRSALVAPDNGLADLYQIAKQAALYLHPQGWLWLEHGYDQAHAVAQKLRALGFHDVQHRHDGQHLRLTGGCVTSSGQDTNKHERKREH